MLHALNCTVEPRRSGVALLCFALPCFALPCLAFTLHCFAFAFALALLCLAVAVASASASAFCLWSSLRFGFHGIPRLRRRVLTVATAYSQWLPRAAAPHPHRDSLLTVPAGSHSVGRGSHRCSRTIEQTYAIRRATCRHATMRHAAGRAAATLARSRCCNRTIAAPPRS